MKFVHLVSSMLVSIHFYIVECIGVYFWIYVCADAVHVKAYVHISFQV